MAVKVPFQYQYREFKNSKLATFVDKHTHKPSSRAMLWGFTILLEIVVLTPLQPFIPSDVRTSGIFGFLLFLLGGVVPFVGIVLLLPKLSDHFDWAGKIARAKAKKDLERMRRDFLEEQERRNDGSADRKS